MKRSRLFLRLGAWGFLLTFVAHTLGQMEGLPAPANETERQLFDLMTGYRRGPGGFERSTMDFVNGFSISMSAFCLFGALLAFVVARSKDDGVVRAAAVVYAAWAGVLVAISWRYFFAPPLICFAVVFACMVAAVATSRPAASKS